MLLRTCLITFSHTLSIGYLYALAQALLDA